MKEGGQWREINTDDMGLDKFLQLWHESLSRIILRQEGQYAGGVAWVLAPIRLACNSRAISRKHSELQQVGDEVGKVIELALQFLCKVVSPICSLFASKMCQIMVSKIYRDINLLNSAHQSVGLRHLGGGGRKSCMLLIPTRALNSIVIPRSLRWREGVLSAAAQQGKDGDIHKCLRKKNI